MRRIPLGKMKPPGRGGLSWIRGTLLSFQQFQEMLISGLQSVKYDISNLELLTLLIESDTVKQNKYM